MSKGLKKNRKKFRKCSKQRLKDQSRIKIQKKKPNQTERLKNENNYLKKV